ncbi:sensor histidine kinase [Egbenema bharatensis]|uniref:sensor histidine kinase n=1 Tax=Egbenema bharatensis TaxID=3463334 RepID=UPI003A88016A
MKLNSFRLRIAVLSTVLAGSSLMAFSFVAWRLIYVAKVSRLDARLEQQTRRAARPRLSDWWPGFVRALPGELGTDVATPIRLQVLDANGSPIYQSEDWSEDWSAELRIPALPTPPSPASQPPQLNRSRSPRTFDSLEDSEIHPDFRFPGAVPVPEPRLGTQTLDNGSWRVGAVRSAHAQAVIAVSLEAIDQEMGAIRNIFLVAISGTLLVVAVGAWGLAGSALRPIRKLTTEIQHVTITGLDRQVPVGEADVEFVQLIQVFNQMLERLERSFKQASRFSGDAAHELKTPLAILQGELERAMQHAEPGSELQQNLSNLLDEVSRLNGIVRKLLLLSLADAGQMSLYTVAVDLSEMLTVMLEDMELLAPHLTVQMDIADHLWVWGDRDLLMQVLQNLISNAIKYNLPNGWIQIQGQQQDQSVRITVTNASNPIPDGERDRIFDRFYRGDPARNRKVEGVGLGLSLSREIARAHNGDLILNEAIEGQTALTLTLPLKD